MTLFPVLKRRSDFTIWLVPEVWFKKSRMFGQIRRFGQIPNSGLDAEAFGEIAKYSGENNHYLAGTILLAVNYIPRTGLKNCIAK